MTTDGVMVAYPYGDIDPQFHRSLVHLLVRDGHRNGYVAKYGNHLMYETTNIAHGRNQIVRHFLASDMEWLWFVDTDMVFADDTLDRLMSVADKQRMPIVGALCFARMRGDAQEIVPTLYTITDDGLPARVTQLGEPGLMQVAMTGTGCLLIHRSVFEKVAASEHPTWKRPMSETAFPWFEYVPWVNPEGKADVMGEDLVFCLRAGSCGFPVFVDTRIEVGHVKRFVVDTAMFMKEQQELAAVAEIPNYVVMPVKGKTELTRAVLDQLQWEEADYAGVLVYDNAFAEDDALTWTAAKYTVWSEAGIEIIDANGMSIHEMWNAGIRECLKRSPVCNIAILNNDLELGPRFLSSLAKALRSDNRLLAVSPNYDKREIGPVVQPVRGIAAGREDGSGGLAGFAFMVKGEMFAAGFPMFDEQFELWYGDNDFVLNIEAVGGWYGITGSTSVVHIGGGSQTAGGDGKRLGTPELEAMARRDRERFLKKWQGQEAANAGRPNRASRRRGRKISLPDKDHAGGKKASA